MKPNVDPRHAQRVLEPLTDEDLEGLIATIRGELGRRALVRLAGWNL